MRLKQHELPSGWTGVDRLLSLDFDYRRMNSVVEMLKCFLMQGASGVIYKNRTPSTVEEPLHAVQLKLPGYRHLLKPVAAPVLPGGVKEWKASVYVSIENMQTGLQRLAWQMVAVCDDDEWVTTIDPQGVVRAGWRTVDRLEGLDLPVVHPSLVIVR